MTMLVVPKKFSADFINRVFYPLEYSRATLQTINSGRCYDWAYYAYCLWNNVQLWSCDTHAWVHVGEKFYDSESPDGVRDYSQLGCNSRWGWEKEPKPMNIGTFKSMWSRIGSGRRKHWHLLAGDIRERGFSLVRI